jgi:nucleotide-binding universal stress UspA family protein
VQGRIHDALIQFADEHDADLLLINLESKGVLERVVLGATAERIIRRSHVPVLSVPVKTGAALLRSNSAEKLEAHI